MGSHLLERLQQMARTTDAVSNARGRGLLCAIDLPTTEYRDALRARCLDHGVVMLGCGSKSIRFRTPLTVTIEEIDRGVDVLVEQIHQMP